jgi:MoxR-like ATPase
MRPIPAPRIGESHGLLRAINTRERVRLDEFLTEFGGEELFPPGLENALGRTRQFVSYARSAGLVKEDRGVVELTEIGKRYVRAGDDQEPFAVSGAQADWLRRQLLEKHMTDSIFHGLAIGLSLLSSVAPGTRVSTLDFGRSLGYLGRAGWDNDNTLQIQGERYLALMRDMELIDENRAVTPTGSEIKNELTLPIHMSLTDIAAQQNPGGADAVRAEGEAEWARLAEEAAPEPEPEAAPEPAAAAPAPASDTGEWQDVGPGAFVPATPAAPEEPPPPPPVQTAPPPAPAPTPAAEAPPTPPADIWDTAEPHETTAAYAVVPPATPAPAPEPEPAAPPPPPEPVEPPRPQDAATVISPPSHPEPAPPPPVREAPPATTRAASDFLDAAAIRQAAERQGVRLPQGVYANVAAALAAGKHVVITGAPGAGKTVLALATAQAASTAGRSSGAVLVTASERWSAGDTLGRRARSPDQPAQPGHVVDAAGRGKWLVIDELDRAPLDRALGALSTFLSGLPVTLPYGGEAIPPGDWRVVATAATGELEAAPALLRRFAMIEIPAATEEELGTVIDAAAQGDATAAGAARRLIPLTEIRPLGAGVLADAARHAAERNAIEPADERTLARELYSAYVERLMTGLDDRAQVRLRELLGGL